MLAAQAAAGKGDGNATLAALHILRDVFERLPGGATDDELSIWGFSERALRFSEAHTLALIGHRREADRAMDQAFVLYPPELVHGLADLRLIQAYTLVGDHDISQGLDHAMAACRARRSLPRAVDDRTSHQRPGEGARPASVQELRALTASRASVTGWAPDESVRRGVVQWSSWLSVMGKARCVVERVGATRVKARGLSGAQELRALTGPTAPPPARRT